MEQTVKGIRMKTKCMITDSLEPLKIVKKVKRKMFLPKKIKLNPSKL